MTGTARRVHAARGSLARLVVVVAVLAGVAFAAGMGCTDGMATAMPMSSAASSANAARDCGSPAAMGTTQVQERGTADHTSQLTAACAAPHAAGAVARAEDGSPGSGGWGGVLATCLAFLVAVVAAVAGLRPAGWRSIVPMLPATGGAVIRAVWPRAPSLAVLCLLRT